MDELYQIAFCNRLLTSILKNKQLNQLYLQLCILNIKIKRAFFKMSNETFKM